MRKSRVLSVLAGVTPMVMGAVLLTSPASPASAAAGQPPAEESARSAARSAAATSDSAAATSADAASWIHPRLAEKLDRGLVAVSTPTGVLVSWRLLPSDPHGIGFHVYRDGQRVTSRPVTDSTNVLDKTGMPGAGYELRAVQGGHVDGVIGRTTAWSSDHLDIPIDRPAGGTTPDGVAYTYDANDASVGDLDGDGQYEIVLKWNPTNAKDNSQSGYTGEVFVDAYELTGKRLWRIALGRNIRAGAHYTQFLVYDLDGDGRAEVVAKTADGTTDAAGRVIGDPAADYRNTSGYVLDGPEFLTIFDGRSGRALTTTSYEPPRGNVCDWGDCYGNRVDRFLAAVAYLDGKHPSFVMARGYYTRTVLVAYDWRRGKLTHRWTFDSNQPGNESYVAQGNHNLSVGDVDGDGRDEIIYGAMAVDDDGTGLYNTGLGHGDALHLGDLDPTHPGLEVFQVHEHTDAAYGIEFRDADSGAALWGVFTGRDTGRGLSGDVDPAHPGEEAWASQGGIGGIFTAQGELLSSALPRANFAIWWDGDLGREILDHEYDATIGAGVPWIGKWDPATQTTPHLLDASGTLSDNGTKGTPALQADLIGDWREEVLWRTADSSALRLYATPYPTSYRLPTLMSDPIYRLGIVWQNVAYNQPPHTSYFLGYDMTAPH